MAQGRIYSIYPTLLNNWHLYLTEAGYTRGVDDENGDTVEEHIVFVDEKKLIDSINRVPFPTTQAQQYGKDFEDMVLGRMPVMTGTVERAIKEARKYVPGPFRNDNVYTAGVYKVGFNVKVIIYGYIDTMGAGRIVDIKTTSQYDSKELKYFNSHQLFYLHNLFHAGYKKMQFVINTKNEIYVETYRPNVVDWELMRGEVETFIEFLEDRTADGLIYDKRIFTDVRQDEKHLHVFGYNERIQQIGVF